MKKYFVYLICFYILFAELALANSRLSFEDYQKIQLVLNEETDSEKIQEKLRLLGSQKTIESMYMLAGYADSIFSIPNLNKKNIENAMFALRQLEVVANKRYADYLTNIRKEIEINVAYLINNKSSVAELLREKYVKAIQEVFENILKKKSADLEFATERTTKQNFLSIRKRNFTKEDAIRHIEAVEALIKLNEYLSLGQVENIDPLKFEQALKRVAQHPSYEAIAGLARNFTAFLEVGAQNLRALDLAVVIVKSFQEMIPYKHLVDRNSPLYGFHIYIEKVMYQLKNSYLEAGFEAEFIALKELVTKVFADTMRKKTQHEITFIAFNLKEQKSLELIKTATKELNLPPPIPSSANTPAADKISANKNTTSSMGSGQGEKDSTNLAIISEEERVKQNTTWENLKLIKDRGIIELLDVASRFISDDLIVLEKNKRSYTGREAEAARIAEVLLRMEHAIPVLVGDSEVGKRSIVYRFTDMAKKRQFVNKIANIQFNNPLVMETTLERISFLFSQPVMDIAVHAVVADLFTAVKKIEQKIGRPVILFISDIDQYNERIPTSRGAFLRAIEHAHYRIPINLILSVKKNYESSFEDAEKLSQNIEIIPVKVMSKAEMLKALKAFWVPLIESEYEVKFTKRALEVLVEKAGEVEAKSLFAGAIRALQDMAIRVKAKDIKTRKRISPSHVYDYITSLTELPVNPYDARELNSFLVELETKLNIAVIGQERMVQDTVNLFRDLLMDTKARTKSINLMGPTGVGKTEVALQLSKMINAGVLEISANEYLEKHTLRTLVGAPPSYIGYEKGGGELIKFLRDPTSKLKIVVINEIERMHPDVKAALMEFEDRGIVRAGDGQEVRASKVFIIKTSNRADHLIYPEGMENWTEKEIDARLNRYKESDLRRLYSKSLDAIDNAKADKAIVGRTNKFSLAWPITTKRARKIVRQKIEQEIAKEAAAPPILHLEVSDALVDYVMKSSYKMLDGARPLVTKVKSLVNTAIMKAKNTWSLQHNSSVFIDILGNDIEPRLSITETSTKARVDIKIESVAEYDPLRDLSLVKRMEELPAKMASRLFGQDYVIRSVSDASISHAFDVGNKKPLSIFLVGLTGTGKTETGKALAYAKYGSAKRHSLIELGNVVDGQSWDMIFGVESRFGNTKPGVFEQALINNPNGGVIIFDEASNMGGGNKALKELFFKRFYTMMDEGRWVSPTNPENVYQLKDYIFLFTGNDGERIFQQNASDDLRLADWKRFRKQNYLEKLLLESGIPEAFLGRLADIILMRPLVTKEVGEIALKLVNLAFESYRKKGIEIEFDRVFIEKIAKTFFSQSKGARSIRNFVEIRVNSYIAQALISVTKKTGGDVKGYKIRLDLTDNLPEKPYVEDLNFKRDVSLELRVRGPNGKSFSRKVVDVTVFAPQQELPMKETAWWTAIHEAGHATTNSPKDSYKKIDLITIYPKANYLGYARYEALKGAFGKNPTRASVISNVATMLAGGLAQKFAGGDFDAGWRNDLMQANKLVYIALTEGGLHEGSRYIARNEKNEMLIPSGIQKELEKAQKAWVKEAEQLAIQRLEKNWNLLKRVAERLMEVGEITGDEFRQIKEKVSKDRTLPEWKNYGKVEEQYLMEKRKERYRDTVASKMCRHLNWNK